MALPMQFVGQAVSQVFFPSAVEAHRNGSIAVTTEAVFKKLLVIGAPVLLLIGLAAPELFAVVFGEEWREAGIYAQWLTPWVFLVFLSSPLSIIPSVVEKQPQEACFHLALLLSRVGVLYIGSLLNDERAAIALFAVVSAFFRLGFMLWVMRLSGNKVSHTLQIVLRESIAVVPLALPMIIVKLLVDSDLYRLGSAGLSVVLVACWLAKKLRGSW
jgi:O-antigen/teichoic acid export membrane protein